METLIKNVNILNPNEEIQTSCNVLIEDKHIKQISGKELSVKDNVKIIDGQDNYLMPGFIDCHAHIMANGFHKEENMANPLALHFYNAIKHGNKQLM